MYNKVLDFFKAIGLIILVFFVVYVIYLFKITSWEEIGVFTTKVIVYISFTFIFITAFLSLVHKFSVWIVEFVANVYQDLINYLSGSPTEEEEKTPQNGQKTPISDISPARVGESLEEKDDYNISFDLLVLANIPPKERELIPKNYEELKERFPDITEKYKRESLEKALKQLRESKVEYRPPEIQKDLYTDEQIENMRKIANLKTKTFSEGLKKNEKNKINAGKIRDSRRRRFRKSE